MPRRLVGSLCAGLLTGVTLAQGHDAQKLPRPTATQLRWQEAEFGVVLHFDMHTFGAGRYVQRKARVTPVADVNQFAPAQLDCEQWVRAAKAAGARFAILTASHESGFRLWQSDANPYCLKSVEWGDGKRDIIAEFHRACVKHGILPGVYMGTRWNAQLGVLDFKVTERSRLTQAQYNRLIEREVEEICTRYGPWFEFWFDGGAHGPDQGGPDLLAIVSKHQPDAVFYHNLQRADARWGGSESGTVPYPCWASFPFPVTGAGESARPEIARNGFALLKSGDPDGAYWLPAMSDAPLRGHGGHEWFWEPDDERLIYPLDKLLDMYCRSVGHNSTLILGLTPDDRGLLPDADVKRLRELGVAVRDLFHELLGERTDVANTVVDLALPRNAAIDVVVLQEDIRHGERVRKYELQARDGERWRTIASGTCIGHKRIHRFAERQPAEELRLRIDAAVHPPRIRRVAAYRSKSAR